MDLGPFRQVLLAAFVSPIRMRRRGDCPARAVGSERLKGRLLLNDWGDFIDVACSARCFLGSVKVEGPFGQSVARCWTIQSSYRGE